MDNASVHQAHNATPAARPVVGVLKNPKRRPRQIREQNERMKNVTAMLAEMGIDVREIEVRVTQPTELPQIYRECSGFIVLGADSNVHPKHYGQRPTFGRDYDLRREKLSFPIIEHCVDNRIPLLAICRGFQELITLLGGQLEQNISKVSTRVDHAYGYNHPQPSKRYADAHPITLAREGMLRDLWGDASNMVNKPRVNSLHRQGAVMLNVSRRLDIEAWCGPVVEAVSVPGHPFAVGVQWHPEGHPKLHASGKKNRLSQGLFDGFGKAVIAYSKMEEARPCCPKQRACIRRKRVPAATA